MVNYSIDNILNSTDRYKLYLISSTPTELQGKIASLEVTGVNNVNIGEQLSQYIDSLDDYRYLNIDVYDFIIKTLDKNKAKLNYSNNNILAIYNFGILLESDFKLNVVKLFNEFSKSTVLILVWENQVDDNVLSWSTQQRNVFLDFKGTPLKQLQYVI